MPILWPDVLLTALQHGKEPISIAADQRTNQIVATGGAEDLSVAEGLISQLDVEAPERPQARRNVVTGSSSTSSSSQNDAGSRSKHYEVASPSVVASAAVEAEEVVASAAVWRGRRRRPADSAAVEASAARPAAAAEAVAAGRSPCQTSKHQKSNFTMPKKRRKKQMTSQKSMPN